MIPSTSISSLSYHRNWTEEKEFFVYLVLSRKCHFFLNLQIWASLASYKILNEERNEMHVFGILIYVTFVHCMSFHLSISFSMLYTWHACLLSLVLIGKLRVKQKSHKYKFRLSCWNLVLSLSGISCRHAKMLQLSLTLDFLHITNIYKLQAL